MGDFAAILPLPISVAQNKASAFTHLAGWALLMHSVDAMRASGGAEPRRIVVATAGQLLADVHACLAAHSLSDVDVVVAGGQGTRTDCIRSGAAHLAALAVAPRYIVIHDHRRPLASADVCDRVMAELRSGSEVVLPMLDLVDSVKTVDAHGSVTATVDRSTLRAVQYPRGFAAARLPQLVAACLDDDFDELKQASQAGLTITTVHGDPDAFVVDVPRDLRLGEAIISCRLSDQR